MNIPGDLRYTSDHEWVRVEGDRIRVGITDYAQDALGDVVFIEAPAVGTVVEANQGMGEVESTKSVSDLYSPISGAVIEINERLDENPGLLNDDPYGDGWICIIEVTDTSQLASLLEPSAYAELTGD